MLKLFISSSRLLDQIFKAFMKEKPPGAYLVFVFYCFLRIILSSKALISWDSASTYLSFRALSEGCALVAD